MKESNHHELKPAVMVGKEGLTDGVIALVKKQLKQKKVIKVKFLKSALTKDKKAVFKELAEKTNTEILHSVGFVVVLRRKI